MTTNTLFRSILGSLTSKHSSIADQGSSSLIGEAGEEGEAGGASEGVEEVLVEVDGEGDMVDEFRREQQLEKTKKKLFRGKKVTITVHG